jgi:hypothetical protein
LKENNKEREVQKTFRRKEGIWGKGEEKEKM